MVSNRFDDAAGDSPPRGIQRRSRGAAASRPGGISTSRPRRRRDSPPWNVRVAAAAPLRVVPAEYPRRDRGVAAPQGSRAATRTPRSNYGNDTAVLPLPTDCQRGEKPPLLGGEFAEKGEQRRARQRKTARLRQPPRRSVSPAAPRTVRRSPASSPRGTNHPTGDDTLIPHATRILLLAATAGALHGGPGGGGVPQGCLTPFGQGPPDLSDEACTAAEWKMPPRC